jgi:alanyl-tRNA synthetase
MTSKKIREQFFSFFKEKEHKIVASAPVVPFDDPTLLFTNAGMNQFKDVFLGNGKRDYSRASDTQKCIRVRCWETGLSAIIIKRKPLPGHGNY